MKNDSVISWFIFIDEMISYYVDIKRNSFFFQLVNLTQKGPIIDHIQQFEKLSLRAKNISYYNLFYLFIGTLKENIQHEVRLLDPGSFENAFRVARKAESKDMYTRRTTTNTYI